MKIPIALLILVLPFSVLAEDAKLQTLRYRVYQWSSFKNPKKDPPPAVDPFAVTKNDDIRTPKTNTLEGAMAYALDIQITEENKKYIFYDGASIYARLSKPEHQRLQTAMEQEGQIVSDAKELEIEESLRKKKPDVSKK